MEKTAQRLGWVDEAKGIGILLIVLGHTSYLFGPVSNVASYFKIAIFYVISGYLTSLHAGRGGVLPELCGIA